MADSDKALPLSVLSTIRDWVRSLIPTKTSDLTNDSGFAQKNIWYGTCGTAAGTAAKVVTTSSGDFKLATGSMVRVYFTNANTYNGTATLNVDGKGAKNISRVGSTTTTRYYWSAGEVVDFVYDGTRFVMSRSGTATTTYFGLTKLATSAYSTATGTALTPQSLNGLAQYMLSGVEPYSASATYAVGDRVRYGYYIYECNTAITTAEAWTAAHWTALEPLLDMIEAKADSEDVPTKTSDLTNDSGFITGYTETDPTVPSWAKASSKPSYTASEVGAVPTSRKVNGKALSSDITLSASDVSALPSSTAIPSKTSDLTNDSGFITGYTETDPTVPSWAKASSKPSYTASEVGALADTGGEVTGDITLKAAAATDSKSLIFQRGTLTDNYNDWRIQDRGGFLYFDQRGQGSSSFANQVVFNTSGNVSATSFSGSGASLTSLNASNLSSGTVPSARLPIATTSDAGAVKVDGSTVTISNGVISATGGGTLPIDSALDDNSTNAVQNRVIKAAIDAKQDELTFDSTPTPNSNNPVTSGGIDTAISSAVITALETSPIMFPVNVVGNQAFIQAQLAQIAMAYASAQGCVFVQPLAAMTGWSDANIRIYQATVVDMTTGFVKLFAADEQYVYVIDLLYDANNQQMSGVFRQVMIPDQITVDDAIDATSTNPVENQVIANALALKAPLASPALTGTPTAPTASAGTNTTQIATTAFVNAAIDDCDTFLTRQVTQGDNISLSANTGGSDCGFTAPSSTYTSGDVVYNLVSTTPINIQVANATTGGTGASYVIQTNARPGGVYLRNVGSSAAKVKVVAYYLYKKAAS